MRRKIGLVLLGLGVLMLVLAPLSRWYAYPRLAVVPDDVAERVSSGQDVTVLDLGAVVAQEGPITRETDVRSVRKIIPDVDDGTGSVAVWETSVTSFDELGDGATPEDNVLSYYEERVALDRHTAESIGGYDQYYSPTGDEADIADVEHTGYYFKLPFQTERRDYEFWDSAIGQTRPMVFDGEDEIDGLAVYRFVQRIEPTQVAALEVPGALFGRDGAVVADRVYANTRTIWVEPHTGAIVKGQEEQDSYLEYEGERGPAIVQGTLAYTAEQVAANVDEYAESARVLELARTTGPLVALAGGAVLVVAGLVLARRAYAGRRAARHAEEAGAETAGGAVVEPEVAGSEAVGVAVVEPEVAEPEVVERKAAERKAAEPPGPVEAGRPRSAAAAVHDDDDVFDRYDEDEETAGRLHRY